MGSYKILFHRKYLWKLFKLGIILNMMIFCPFLFRPLSFRTIKISRDYTIFQITCVYKKNNKILGIVQLNIIGMHVNLGQFSFHPLNIMNAHTIKEKRIPCKTKIQQKPMIPLSIVNKEPFINTGHLLGIVLKYHSNKVILFTITFINRNVSFLYINMYVNFIHVNETVFIQT